MDLLTQGLLGSSLALSIARPEQIRTAGLIGLLAGLSADLDFFIQSANDPLLNLEFHRHFTHSIFFIPIAAIVLSFLFWPLFRQKLSWRQIFLFCLAGYLLSGFLDACTSYGTRLLWPLSDQRISFNIISIIDPIFTLCLLLGVVFSIKTRSKNFAVVFLIICVGYLTLGWYQHGKVEQLARERALEHGHDIERLLAKPTLGNLWLWRTVYLTQGTYHVNAIRRNPFNGDSRVFPGKRINQFKSAENTLNIPQDSTLQNDINRFGSFSDHYLAQHPDIENIIIDVRYSNLPHDVLPLWGIEINTEAPEQHAHYQVYRDSSEDTRSTFFDMLSNRLP